MGEGPHISAGRVSSRAVARAAATAVGIVIVGLGPGIATTAASGGFGPLSGAGGCLVAPGTEVKETQHCGPGKGLNGPNAVAISPDGTNVYVASGHFGSGYIQKAFGSVAILKRDAATGALAEIGCLSSDGTDGRDGASGACSTMPSLLGADGIAVSGDGSTVFVTSGLSGSVVAFTRDAASGALTRLGCFQYHPPLGAPCSPANVFTGAGAVVASADNKSIYVASPEYGAVSAFTASLIPGAASGGGSSTGATGSSGGSGSGTTGAGATAPTPGIGALFSGPPGVLANPCVAVNGLDGSCTAGVATVNLNDLALSPDGHQLYATAPESHAVDVFTRGASGTLTQSSCLMTGPPPGLCNASQFKDSPRKLALSPDGKNVYVVDSSGGNGRLDVLARDPATGALSDSSCVDFLAPPPEKHEESEEEKEESKEEEKREPAPAGPCTSHAAGLSNVSLVAVSGDGTAVYAFGSGTAAFFARDPATGKLTETSCAANEDKRCASVPALPGSKEGFAVSPDGHQVYFADPNANAVFAFTLGATVITARASATHAGATRLLVSCPRSMHRPCAGRVRLARVLARRAAHRRARRHVVRAFAGSSVHFTVMPGSRATVSVRLSRYERHLLVARGRLRLAAVIAADPLAGGSGFGRHLLLKLGRY